MPELTGPFETGKLPKIAQGAVTVAIARTIDPALREEFEAWAAEILQAVNAAPGSLGGTVLAPAEPGDPYHMVFRFKDALHLRQWERSETRQRFRESGDRFIVSEKVTVTAGTEEFFDALGDVPKKRSPLGRFFFDLAWVYPVAVLFTLVLAPYIGRLTCCRACSSPRCSSAPPASGRPSPCADGSGGDGCCRRARWCADPGQRERISRTCWARPAWMVSSRPFRRRSLLTSSSSSASAHFW